MMSATIVACFALKCAKAQTVNGIRLSEIRSDYIQVKGINRAFSDKVLVSLEYGQNAPNLDNTYIKDDDGKKMEFNSIIEFVNKSKAYGYNLFNVFSEQNGKDSSIAVYVLKRK